MPPKRNRIVHFPPTTIPKSIDRSKPYLRLCVDYGTTHGSGHTQLVDGGRTSQTATIHPVELKQHHGLEIKQVCCYDKRTGKVIYGSRDVTNYLLTCQDPQAASQTLQFVKMASIPQFRNSEHVKHVRRVLHGEEDTGYLRDFLQDHFASIFQDALAFHQRQCPSFNLEERTAYAAYIDSLPIELQLPVPVMMEDDGRADFRIAALAAGAAEVELREEPLCVAAKYMPKLARDGWVKIGQCILVADIGGMTADFATTKLLDDSEFRIQRVGQCHGNGAGSHLLNAQLIHHFLQKPDLQEYLEQLEIDRHNLVQQLSEWFDDVKREIDTGGKLEFLFPVLSSHGQSGVEGRAHNKVFRFSRDTILGFYHTWIEEVKEELRKHISTKSKETFAGAIIVGGGSRSVMFQEEIAKFLDTHGIRVLSSKGCEFPCSEGGLTQHFFEKDTLPTPCVWYISRTEEYCEQTHPDAKLHENRPSGSLDHTVDPSRQALPSPGPSSLVLNDNDSEPAIRQQRKRTGEDSRVSTKRTRNSVQHAGAVAPHGSNTNTNTNIVARQLQELERAMMGASREHRASSTLSYPSRAPNFAGPSSPARSSTVCRSPSPGALSRRRDRIVGSDTSMLLRAFE
jgi:hypothetical protein